MCDDIQKCCRICLDIESDHVSILDDPTIGLHLKSCLSLTVSSNDHLPKTICVSCVSSLDQFYNFQLNARCSQDWLESSVQEINKKSPEIKLPLQPLPDCEYNSDSLLEFLNNTANIEEYLNNLGKEDIPCIVNMLDKNENSMEITRTNKTIKVLSPRKEEPPKKFHMEKDALYTDFKMVKELIKKDSEPKKAQTKVDKTSFMCYGCKTNYDSVQKLLQHLSVCDTACRTCMHCNLCFDSKQQMQQHSLKHHTSLTHSCISGEDFTTTEQHIKPHKSSHTHNGDIVGCLYRCMECGDMFKERLQLYRHAKEHVTSDVKRICNICGHTFLGDDALLKHMKEIHELPASVIYRCKICNTTSTDRKEMYIHVKDHTVRPEPTRHLCESCGRSFATHTSLFRHSRQHEANRNKCIIYDRMLTDEKSFNTHIAEHIKMVMCEKCGQQVNQRKLDNHSCV